MNKGTWSLGAVLGLGLMFATGLAASAEIKVMSSAGFFEPYRKLIPEFERTTGHRIDTVRGVAAHRGL